MFARGEVRSVKCLLDAIYKFSSMSGLKPNIQKSKVYFCNVNDQMKAAILNIMPFDEGYLPVRYLGVPLVSSGLKFRHCSALMEALDNRINSWKNKFLSFAGKLQLIVSVLSAMHIYWSSVFVLPKRVIKEIESKMRNFLWCKGPMKAGKARIAWKDICVPKNEGGLGIRRIRDMNLALMASRLWSIISKKNSLWVNWIYSDRLKDKSVWNYKVPASCGSSWKKMMNLRPLYRQFFWSAIGDGTNTSAWYDFWCSIGPLCSYISPRMIHSAGFDVHSKVADLYVNGVWSWPASWFENINGFNNDQMPHINPYKQDTICWKRGDEVLKFTTTTAWDSIRFKKPIIRWADTIWFSQCIPRHAFFLWLAFRKRLSTQDRIRSWNLAKNDQNLMCCVLCQSNIESHEHLFFECSFSADIWERINMKMRMNGAVNSWDDTLTFLISKNKSRAIRIIICKLLLAATVYHIWKERNLRFVKNLSRPPDIVFKQIIEDVRYKLLGLKIKLKPSVIKILEEWEIRKSDTHDDGG
jgi:hypothetical protein